MISFSGNSWIRLVDYYSDKTMIIMMGKKTYSYKNVPFSVFMDFMTAESRGRFFNYNIRGKYDE